MKIDKVKVVSSSVPRPSHCSLWPVSVGSQRAEWAGGKGVGGGLGQQRRGTKFTKQASLFELAHLYPSNTAGSWGASPNPVLLATVVPS